jgi:CheR methyltransferase, SAM binding domain
VSPEDDCVAFLQWALPRIGRRWAGYRKVHRQVCRRVRRRAAELGCVSLAGYRARLERDPDEWSELDALTNVTISRFYRDRGVFAFLQSDVLPALADTARDAGRPLVRAWSAGCASGEEPFTLAIVWELAIAAEARLQILATDTDPALLRRAAEGRYPPSALRELPGPWRDAAFARDGDEHGSPSRDRPQVQRPLAARRVGATGSHVPCKSLSQARATSMPGTVWPVGRLPPDSSRGRKESPVLTPPNFFRHVISGSLAFAFLARTCRARWRDFSATLTTTALDRSSSRWFEASACTAAPEDQTSISCTAPHPVWSSTSSLLQRSWHTIARNGAASAPAATPRPLDAIRAAADTVDALAMAVAPHVFVDSISHSARFQGGIMGRWCRLLPGRCSRICGRRGVAAFRWRWPISWWS